MVAWVKEQQATTGSYFASLDDKRSSILARLEQLQNYPRAGCPYKRGSVSFQSRNTGLQNQDVLYKAVGVDLSDPAALASAEPLLDLNAVDPAGTTSLGSAAMSDDGALFAYGLSRGGSDWQEVHVKNVASGADLPDVIPWAKFTSLAWLKDGSVSSGAQQKRHNSSSGRGAAEEEKGAAHLAPLAALLFCCAGVLLLAVPRTRRRCDQGRHGDCVDAVLYDLLPQHRRQGW